MKVEIKQEPKGDKTVATKAKGDPLMIEFKKAVVKYKKISGLALTAATVIEKITAKESQVPRKCFG